MARSHRITDTATTTAATTEPWLGLSAALTEAIPPLAEREDLTVTIAPGAGHGHPACFFPALATVEVSPDYLDGVDPHTMRPERPSDRERYPATWGTLVHEAAHAAHTHWTTPKNLAGSAAAKAADLLEESRIEANQLTRRPGDRHWLRAAATRIILADYQPDPDDEENTPHTTTGPSTTAGGPAPATSPPAAPGAGGSSPLAPTEVPPQVPMSPWEAAHAAGLILARVDAGVLDDHEVLDLARTVISILGPDRFERLREIWQEAHATPDDDAETMLDLGRKWCDVVGTDPDQPPPGIPGSSQQGSGPSQQDSGSGQQGSGQQGTGQQGSAAVPSRLAAAINTTLQEVSAATGTGRTQPTAGHGPAQVETDARNQAREAAGKVFGPTTTGGTIGGGSTAVRATREPFPQERAAASRVARALRSAGHRERTTTTTTAPTPPGRLSLRGALAADAQRAAGALPTAEPFTRTHRRHVPNPPLRVGIACDVSGSMSEFAVPVASAAWILARATSQVPDAKSATVIFGETVRPVTFPGRSPRGVAQFSANDGYEQIANAIDALDGALDLARPGTARLLVIVSDGQFKDDQPRLAQKKLNRLAATGCALLWLAPLAPYITPLDGPEVVILADPTDAAEAIARAATRALSHA